MKFSFRNNILLFFSILSIGVILLGIGTAKNNARYKDTVYWVEHTQQVLYETEQLLSSASDMESSMRGYALTNNAAFLSPFIDTKNILLIHLHKLKALTKDNTRQQVRIDTLSHLIQKKIAFSSAVVQTRKEMGFYASKDLIMSGMERIDMDSIQKTLTAIQEEENQLLKMRKNVNENSNQNLGITFRALLIAIVLALLIASVVVWNNENARRKAEKLLNENQKLLQSVIDNTSSLINLKDLNGKYLLVNKEYKKSFSEHGNLIKKTVFDIYPEKTATAFAEEDRKVIDNKTARNNRN